MVMVDVETAARYYDYLEMEKADSSNTNVLLSTTTETALIEDARRPIDDENYWPSSSSTTSQTYM